MKDKFWMGENLTEFIKKNLNKNIVMQIGQKYKVTYADFSKFKNGEIVTLIRGNHWSKSRFENNKGVVDDLYATDVEPYIEISEMPSVLNCEMQNPFPIDEFPKVWTPEMKKISKKDIPINRLPCNLNINPYEIDCQGKIIGIRDRFPCTDTIDNSHD